MACEVTDATSVAAIVEAARPIDMAQGGGFPEPYAEMVHSVFARIASEPADQVTHARDVVEAVWRAVTDPTAFLRIPAGADAVALFKN
jgi:hypothetical protein